MALSIDDLVTPLSQDDVFNSIVSTLETLGVPASTWQQAGALRTILRVVSAVIAGFTSIQVQAIRMMFLGLASGPWLAAWALAWYGVAKQTATFAAGQLQLTNSGAGVYSFNAGDVTAQNPTTGKTYVNTAAFSLNPGQVLLVAFQATEAGSASSSGVGTITALETVIVGVTVTNLVAFVGLDDEADSSLTARCQDKFASLSTQGPSGAYDYNARTINGTNQVQVASGALVQPTQPVTRTNWVTNPATGVVTGYVANASGAYATPPNYTNQVSQAITSSTNASPIVVDLPSHGYSTNDQVFISGHLVNTNANGSWTITVVDANNFSLNGSSGNGVGAATGTAYRYSDLDLIDKSVQQNATPNAVTLNLQSATSLAWSVTGSVYVTGSTSGLTDAAITAAASTALAQLASTTAVGGQGTSGVLYLETIRTTIMQANPQTLNVVLTAPTGDVTIAANQVLVAPTVTLTVVRV